MNENPGFQLPANDICQALFGSQISTNVMFTLLKKLDQNSAADTHRMGTNTTSLPASYKSWASLSVGRILIPLIILSFTVFYFYRMAS